MTENRDLLDQLLSLIDLTAAHEIDCDEFLDRSAGFIEKISASPEPPPGWADVVQHLRVCPECNEEFQALRRALEEND